MKLKSFIAIVMSVCLCLTLLLSGCGSETESSEQSTATVDSATADSATADSATDDSAKSDGIDYMVIVNKTHKLPDDWEEKLETVHMTNSIGDDVEVEAKAYDAYLKLKEALEKEGVYVDLDSARRSVADQQRIMDEFTEQYGADYAQKTVAKPGYSEHHTGLALDLYLIIDGKDVTENEDMVQYPEIWEKIHAKLPEYGFILRYLDGKEHITGYGYEPWHIRYIDSADTAGEITSTGQTFEGYLGTAVDEPVTIDYGSSNEDELKDAVTQIKCKFAAWDGCTLKSIRYAGDGAVTEEEIKAEIADDKYTKFAKFLMDFSTGESCDKQFEANKDYTDYKWLMGSTEKDGWEVLDQGY